MGAGLLGCARMDLELTDAVAGVTGARNGTGSAVTRAIFDGGLTWTT
jgi:hypothetical protein